MTVWEFLDRHGEDVLGGFLLLGICVLIPAIRAWKKRS
jgi:hypothetical protein